MSADKFPQPVIRWTGREYELMADYAVEYEYAGRPWRRVIKAGTLTDLASVPHALLWLADNNGDIDGPALFHDMAWSKGWHGYWGSNAIFWQMMKRAGIPWKKRIRYWLGVTNPIAYRNWRAAQKRRVS